MQVQSTYLPSTQNIEVGFTEPTQAENQIPSKKKSRLHPQKSHLTEIY